MKKQSWHISVWKKKKEEVWISREGKIVHSHAYIYRRLMVVDNELVELLSVYSNKKATQPKMVF